MKILVTGGAGFVARHLEAELRAAGYEVFLTDCRNAEYLADLTNVDEVVKVFESVRPDACIHLGAIAFVPDAARNAELLQRVNVGGTVNVLTAIRKTVPKSRLLFVSTAQVLGNHRSVYAMSKATAEECVMQACADGVDAMVARPANHTGPGQSVKYVVPSFVEQALQIKQGKRQGFVVGNLESVRDFTDVRDVVRAYRILIEKGERGKVYAIGSNSHVSMYSLLNQIQKIVGVEGAEVCVDQELWRPTDASPALDVSAMLSLGWSVELPISRTLNDICESMRRKVVDWQ